MSRASAIRRSGSADAAELYRTPDSKHSQRDRDRSYSSSFGGRLSDNSVTPLSDRKTWGKLAAGPPNSPDAVSNFQKRKSSASLSERFAIVVSQATESTSSPIGAQSNPSEPLSFPSREIGQLAPTISPESPRTELATLEETSSSKVVVPTAAEKAPPIEAPNVALTNDSKQLKPAEKSSRNDAFILSSFSDPKPELKLASKTSSEPRSPKIQNPQNTEKNGLETILESRVENPRMPGAFAIPPKEQFAIWFACMLVLFLALGLNGVTLPIFVLFISVFIYYCYVETRLPRRSGQSFWIKH